MNKPAEPDLAEMFRRLFDCYGAQHWWPGETTFEVMVGAILTQNTAWSNVKRAIANLNAARVLDPAAIVALPEPELAMLLKPSGYFNVKARRLASFCGWYLVRGGYTGLQPLSTAELRPALLAVHGIGPETADDILLYAFDRPVFVVDAYTRRLLHRLGWPEARTLGYERLRRAIEARLQSSVPLYNEFHALIVHHAKDICRPRPRCVDCCLAPACPRQGVDDREAG